MDCQQSRRQLEILAEGLMLKEMENGLAAGCGRASVLEAMVSKDCQRAFSNMEI